MPCRITDDDLEVISEIVDPAAKNEALVLLVLHDVFGGVFCSGGGTRGVDGSTRAGGSDAHHWTILSARAALTAELRSLDAIALKLRAESLLVTWFEKKKNEGGDAERIRREIQKRFQKWAQHFGGDDASPALVIGTAQALCVGKVAFGPPSRITEADIEMICAMEHATARKEAAAVLILHDVFGGVFRAHDVIQWSGGDRVEVAAPESEPELEPELAPEPEPEREVGVEAWPAAQSHPGWLTVTVMACRDLPRMDVFDKNDIYVSVLCDGETARTTTDDGGGSDPEWASGDGESLMFDLEPRKPGQKTSVTIGVYDEDAGSADDLCGHCTIDLPEAAYMGPYMNSSGLLCGAEPDGWKSDGQWFVLDNEQKKGKRVGDVKVAIEWSLDTSVVATRADVGARPTTSSGAASMGEDLRSRRWSAPPDCGEVGGDEDEDDDDVLELETKPSFTSPPRERFEPQFVSPPRGGKLKRTQTQAPMVKGAW